MTADSDSASEGSTPPGTFPFCILRQRTGGELLFLRIIFSLMPRLFFALVLMRPQFIVVLFRGSHGQRRNTAFRLCSSIPIALLLQHPPYVSIKRTEVRNAFDFIKV